MSEAEKRSVHTDALATLGTIIGESEKRDAIHLAVEPATAGHTLRPGDDVGFMDDGALGYSKDPVGIVDPFLKEYVKKGQRFWLVVYPRQITSLRHVWTHPAFGDEPVKASPVDKAASKQWLRDFINAADCPSYESVMKVIETGRVLGECGDSYVDEEAIHFVGSDAHGEIPAEFWHHVEVVTGKVQKHRPAWFSCSC